MWGCITTHSQLFHMQNMKRQYKNNNIESSCKLLWPVHACTTVALKTYKTQIFSIIDTCCLLSVFVVVNKLFVRDKTNACVVLLE